MMFAVHVSWQYGVKTTVLPVITEKWEMVRPSKSRQDKSKRVKSGFQPLADGGIVGKRYRRDTERSSFEKEERGDGRWHLFLKNRQSKAYL